MTQPNSALPRYVVAPLLLAWVSAASASSPIVDEKLAADVSVVLRVCHVGTEEWGCDATCSSPMRVLAVLKNESGVVIEPDGVLSFRNDVRFAPYGETTVYVRPGGRFRGLQDWSLNQRSKTAATGYSHPECPWDPKAPRNEACWARCLEKEPIPDPKATETEA